MSRNEVSEGMAIVVVPSHPAAAAVLSGTPARKGLIAGVCARDANVAPQPNVGATTLYIEKVHRVAVHANGAAVNIGDRLYYHDVQTGSPLTSVNNAAAAADAVFGYALGTITIGNVLAIDVKLARA